MRTSIRSRIAAILVLAAVAACMERGMTGSLSDSASLTARANLLDNLLECPANQATSGSAIVGPLGGLVTAGGTSISIPAGALLSPVEVTVTVPASNYMEVDISVSGTEHFLFEAPVVVTLSYARCNRNLSLTPLTVWHIDPATHELLEDVGGVDNKLLKTITFTTGHLSGWGVAN